MPVVVIGEDVPAKLVPMPTLVTVPEPETDAQLLSPRRNVELLGEPVTAVMFDVPMPVNDAPAPLNVVALTVPLTFSAPLIAVVPIATALDQVDVAPVNVPETVKLPRVPTEVRDEPVTPDANDDPVSVPAGAALSVASVPNADPLVFVQVMLPVETTIVQSPPIVNPPKEPELLY